MTKSALYILIIFMLPVYSQKKTTINALELVGCWIDSSEENINGVEEHVYRPCNYRAFPPRRFRFKMILQVNNSCKYLTIGVTDTNTMKPGIWNYDSKTCLLTIKNLVGTTVKSFKVETAEKDILRLTIKK